MTLIRMIGLAELRARPLRTFLSAVGIALGLLYAPKKGTRLQRELKSGIDDFSEKVKDVSGTVAGVIRKVANA